MLHNLTWDPSPEIFRIGGFALRYYSVAFMAAFVLSYVVMRNIFRREGKDIALLDRLLVYVVVGTIIGARLGHCLFYEWDYFRHHPAEIVLPFRWEKGRFLWTGYQGLASHGGAVGILGAVALFARRYRISLIWLLDRLSIVVPLAGAFVRIGNFFNGEIIGKPSGLPWAVVFAREDSQPRHPAQLYEALCYAVIFGLFIFLYKKSKLAQKPGCFFGLFLVLVFGARFIIEFLKENQEPFESGYLLNMGQLLSLPLIAAGIYFLRYYRDRHAKRQN
ncbi:prolipoprotein diacylglyceryl transferase [Chitinophaga varians]|uniref:Phosphatidylglycerol--prolipoprotein diacylglyceryl transferase n=1 Tax=Chitinophaga varians TaxID=2202339 RepID=A0A847RW00_9BACT|nr:prolipoprotein diacylglyceryl transferase [Chitinophaga varians]NLR67036.1 prolipoprotein diacylglyceryl transferase [Chitinophaga varians]